MLTRDGQWDRIGADGEKRRLLSALTLPWWECEFNRRELLCRTDEWRREQEGRMYTNAERGMQRNPWPYNPIPREKNGERETIRTSQSGILIGKNRTTNKARAGKENARDGNLSLFDPCVFSLFLLQFFLRLLLPLFCSSGRGRGMG